MPICTKCKASPSVSNAGMCRPCRAAYDRARYAGHREVRQEQIAAGNRRMRERNRAWLDEYLAGHPCSDCGEADPIVLEFDHRGDDVKVANVADMVSKRSLSAIQVEVAKCDVRCANCHRRVTHRRRNNIVSS